MTSRERDAHMLLDRYTLLDPIAAGGMATVHLGRVKGAGGFVRAVAIKRLHPQLAGDPDFSSMLLDEARLAGAIRHPNVVPTLDVVQAEGELFMVMEYVAGESLARLLREAREQGMSAPAPVGAAIVAGALAGLHAAHEARSEDGIELHIVHRDVSPQNILVGKDGIPRLVDFGIARAAVRAEVTREGQLKGKLRFMAPEQLRGRGVTRCTDIYSAGVVLWEVLTREKLFDGESDAEVFGHVLEGLVSPPSALVDVPEAVDRVVLRAVAREPRDRFATALEMAEALVAALAPASPAEVGAWVEALVGNVLAERAGYLAALDGPPDSVAPSARGHGPPGPRGERALLPGSLRPRRGGSPPAATPTSTRTVTSLVRSDTPLLKLPSIRPEAHETATIEAPAASSLETPPPSASSLETPPASVSRSSRGRAALWIGVMVLGAGALAAGITALRRPEAIASEPPSGAAATAEPASTPEQPTASAPPPVEPVPPPASASATPPGTAAASAHPARGKQRCVPPYHVDSTGIRRVKRECL